MFGSMPAVWPSRQPVATTPPFFINLTTETQVWYNRIVLNGGSVSYAEIIIADNLIRAIQATTWSSHLLVMYPFIGNNIKASIVPLRDSISAGIPYNPSMVDTDCATNKGIVFPGTSTTPARALYTGIQVQQIGLAAGTPTSSPNGGLGWMERNYQSTPGTGTECMGMINYANNNRYVLDLRSTRKFFSWGSPSNVPNVNTTAGNKHYYGERSSVTLRTLYEDGVSIATNTTNDAGSPNATGFDNSLILGGSADATTFSFYKGTCGCAYITDGGLGSSNALALHNILIAYLITSTGR